MTPADRSVALGVCRTSTDTVSDLEAMSDTPPPACYATHCDRPGVWRGTVRHLDGRACESRIACEWHKSANESRARRFGGAENRCKAHAQPVTLEWRRI